MGENFMLDIFKAMNALKEKRQVFHSEADFQFALAWLIQQMYPKANIRLEYPVSNADETQRKYLDILVEIEGQIYPIELKYKTAQSTIECNGETFNLAGQAAQNEACYDFWKDVSRIENVENRKKGFAIFLTNSSYWNAPAGQNACNYDEFRIFGGRNVAKTTLSWQNNETITEGRENPIAIRGNYALNWQAYSEFPETNGIFQYLVVEV